MPRALGIAVAVACLLGCAGGGGSGGGRRDGGGGTGEGGLDAMGSGDGGGDAGGGGTDGGTEPDAGSFPDGGGDLPRSCTDEQCGGGLDEDCDGTVDEGCPCEPGATESCFRGDPRHRGLGACRDGSMLCGDGLEFGTWGPCGGDALEAPEVCDAEGIDEDCDGAPNDGCECVDGDPDLPCGSDVGACMSGVQRCVGGRRTDCEGGVLPDVETCNALDDDCDGVVDDGLRRTCGSDVGACRTGTETCADGVWGACTGASDPVEETCDALDDDCDGLVDEAVTRTCGTDEGRCVAGIETCADGRFGACDGEVGPIAEDCNATDDDCDAMVDESLVRPCGTDVGECTAGTETCAGGRWEACSGSVGPRTEVCDGVRDEDCDGTADEGCGCISGTTRACGTDVGACVAGTQLCDSAGAWGPCTGAVDPVAETCNGADDDCDGMTDEGCDCIGGATRACGTDVGACVTGVETCDLMGRWGPCTGGVTPSPELCNGADDDCDGAIDEGGVCPRLPPVAMCPGDVSVLVGETASLAGAGSDPDGGSVAYAWTVSSRPLGSTAGPMPPDTASTSLTPDAPGDYVLRLCVTDDEGVTTCCTVQVTATSRCTPPAVPTISTCPTSWDRRPVVELPALPPGVTYELFREGDAAAYATVTRDGQNYHRPAAALGPGGPPPGAPVSLFVRACLDADPTCCATSARVTVSLIEPCTTPIAPTASNVVFSEYVIDGDGACPGAATCEAGEAIEITNLSHCPVTLDGTHFGYCNPTSCSAFRWMNFGAADVIPPRGVYVAIRNRAESMCAYPFFGPDDPSLFGLKISTLAMMGASLDSGWFNNSGGGSSVLRIATGAFTSITSGTTLEIVSPYSGAGGSCESVGFDAVDACGNIAPTASPTDVLAPNQLGRLWHPCDAVVAPVPAMCR